MNPKVDFYFDKTRPWQQEIGLLRKLVLDCGLNEELKWGCPCYTYGKANIVLIHVFKEYCALLFFKGALLNDPHNLLIQQTPNVQAARQLRFISTKEIATQADIIKAYIYEAIEVERSGLKVTLKKTEDYPIPDSFSEKVSSNAAFKKSL